MVLMPSRRELIEKATPRKREYARRLKRRATPAERAIAADMRRLGFVAQAPIAGYIVDFYHDAARLVVEIDGGYHQTAEQGAYDARRTAHLTDALGVEVMRFTNRQVMSMMPWVLDQVRFRAFARTADRQHSTSQHASGRR